MVKISGFETHGMSVDASQLGKTCLVFPSLSNLMINRSSMLTAIYFRREIPNFVDRRWVRRHVCESNSVINQFIHSLICRNTDCDYSSAYVCLLTDSDLVGYGMTFTTGRGNDIVSYHHHALWMNRTENYNRCCADSWIKTSLLIWGLNSKDIGWSLTLGLLSNKRSSETFDWERYWNTLCGYGPGLGLYDGGSPAALVSVT